MKLIVIGTGFVGLTHAAVMSESGHEVYAYDIDKTKIKAFNTGKRQEIEKYVNEPNLSSVIAETLNRYLFFVSDITDIIEGTDIFFCCLPTPPNLDGSTDLTAYKKAAHHLAPLLAKREDQRRVVLVNKSTVPIGTARMLQGIMADYNVPNFGVASNPEFLPEGDAVEKSRKPDRVVIGADTEEDFQIIRNLYPQFYNHVRIAYRETTPETAEAIKYVSNTLLLTYISFWNGVGARLGETFNNVILEDLKLGVTADDRISTCGSYVSNGAGGSCFGKDIQSLIYQFRRESESTKLLEEVFNINEFQKSYLIDRAINELNFNFNNKSVALLGLSFKKRTNDMRDSSALVVAETLLARGVKEIKAYDPLAVEEAKHFFDPSKNNLFEKISYHETVSDAIKKTDALFITTDWEEFRGVTGTIQKEVKPPYLVIDGRRMIADYEALSQNGYTYLAVGSKPLTK
ncbi:MAG: nucleotide sugar dehydrogenase [Chloroflexota bacterium]